MMVHDNGTYPLKNMKKASLPVLEQGKVEISTELIEKTTAYIEKDQGSLFLDDKVIENLTSLRDMDPEERSLDEMKE